MNRSRRTPRLLSAALTAAALCGAGFSTLAPAAHATEITNPAQNPAPVTITIDGQVYHDGQDTLPGYDDYACTPIPDVQYDFADNEILYYDDDGNLLKTVNWNEWSRISSYATWLAQQKGSTSGSSSSSGTGSTSSTGASTSTGSTSGSSTSSSSSATPVSSGSSTSTQSTQSASTSAAATPASSSSSAASPAAASTSTASPSTSSASTTTGSTSTSSGSGTSTTSGRATSTTSSKKRKGATATAASADVSTTPGATSPDGTTPAAGGKKVDKKTAALNASLAGLGAAVGGGTGGSGSGGGGTQNGAGGTPVAAGATGDTPAVGKSLQEKVGRGAGSTRLAGLVILAALAGLGLLLFFGNFAWRGASALRTNPKTTYA